MTKRYTCQSKNLVYAISCSKCGAQYIGETEKTLQKRFSQHLGYVRNDHQNKATGQHFNLPGHSLDNMRVSVIETINNKSEFYRKNREKYFIEKFNTKYKGLNRNQKRWYFANCNCFLKSEKVKFLSFWNDCSSSIPGFHYCDYCLMKI